VTTSHDLEGFANVKNRIVTTSHDLEGFANVRIRIVGLPR